MAKKVIVVRVGAKTIRIVHMDNSPVNPTVYGCVRVPTPQGAVVDGEVKNIIDVSRRIKQACQEKGIATKDVIFSLTSSKIANRETTIPFVKDNKIQGIVDVKVGDMFPVDKEKYIFSYVKQGEGRDIAENEEVTDGSEKEKEENEVTDDTKKKKKGLDFSVGKKKKENEVERVIDLLVYAAPIDLVRSYYALAEGCDFNVVGIEVDGNGIFQIMRRQVAEGVEMAVQINRENTLINIMSKERLLLQRVIPYGATSIIEAAMSEPAFQVPEYDKAVKLLSSQRVLLHTLNASNPQGDLSMQKRIELTQSASSLIGNIYRVMEYYNSRYREDPIQSIIVTGNGANIAGIHELMNNELGIPARTPNELTGVSFNRQIEVNANILQYVGCFGAVYSPVNFIPDDIKNKTATKDSVMSIAVVFVAAIVLCVAVSVFSFIQLASAEDAYEAANAKALSLAPIEQRYNELQQTRRRVGTYRLIENTVNTNNNRLHKVLDNIAEGCPDSFTVNGISTTATGGTINCVSTAKLSSVAALVIRLNLISDIKNVTIASSISKGEDSVTKKRQYVYTISYDYVTNIEQMDSVELEYLSDMLQIEEAE
ncbi:MAG: hypothetical protein NC293_13240 [Roseburia sp.]|nr:hypothetical protein [Roseburia sp.]